MIPNLIAFWQTFLLTAHRHHTGAVAALDKLYRWAVERGIISQSPFAYRDVWRRIPYGRVRTAIVTRNQAYERAAKRSNVKFITIDDYRRFRDLGLRGLALTAASAPAPAIVMAAAMPSLPIS